ncbi:Pre-mRNA-splicing factor SPP2 [Smittium mucronatum]|uniref:Pre-mRNA-splicing factor SPP2 n=1 Tax=Smittium mucronatum TaxID=133383 RepID=A0A1R0H5X1_9FUNG|nr:Pre-mRNA-splicing factor SPP2 [Smittium mucronatum]
MKKFSKNRAISKIKLDGGPAIVAGKKNLNGGLVEDSTQTQTQTNEESISDTTKIRLTGNSVANATKKSDGVNENQKLVIPVQDDKNWVESQLSKRKPVPKVIPASIESYGLTILPKSNNSISEIQQKQKNPDSLVDKSTNYKNPSDLRTLAINELKLEGEENQQKLEISVSEDRKIDRDKREFEAEIENMADEMTIEGYEKVPVQDFGAALLRGMGWSEDSTDTGNKKRKVVEEKPRPNLMGLGATPPPPELHFDRKRGFMGISSKLRPYSGNKK